MRFALPRSGNPMLFRPILAIILAVALLPARGAAQDLTADQVRLAIDRGIAFLSRQQKPNGGWDEYQLQQGGVTALCTLALLNAGVESDDDRIQRALRYLREIEPQHTYAASLQTMVFCAAEPRKDLLLIQRNVNWLEQTQVKGDVNKGGWHYPGVSGAADNSNSQFALLALHEASLVGARSTNKPGETRSVTGLAVRIKTARGATSSRARAPEPAA